MKANIAVVTVQGKAYYLIVNELKKKSIPFLSLTPGETIPIEVKVVITTKEEKHLVNHETVLLYQEGTEPEKLVNEALQAVRGKRHFEKLVIGIDPGKVLGLAVLADGKIIETGNCFSVKETVDKIKSVLKNLESTPAFSVTVKIGDGVAEYKEKLLRALDKELSANVVLESVSEAGTSRYLNMTEHRRGLRDIVSATRIAGRNGHAFQRRKTNGSNS